VQQWLLEMCAAADYQGDARAGAPAKTIAESGHEFEARAAAAAHDKTWSVRTYLHLFTLGASCHAGLPIVARLISDGWGVFGSLHITRAVAAGVNQRGDSIGSRHTNFVRP
jgi:hypothetical protein